MKFPNTPQLKEWLERDHPELALKTEFQVDAARFHAFRKQLHAQGDHQDPKGDRQKEAEALDQVALFALLTYQEPKKPAQAVNPWALNFPYFEAGEHNASRLEHPSKAIPVERERCAHVPESPALLIPEFRDGQRELKAGLAS